MKNRTDNDTYLKELAEKYGELLGENDRKFFERVFLRDLEIYRKRVEAISFCGGNRVLDAGCGFGQWTISLAEFFTEVIAIDIAPHRLILLEKILEHYSIENVNLKCAPLDKLTYADGYFSHIFCYGTLFLTDWKRVLKDFYRLLQPGGALYFSANGVGYYLNLWTNQPNEAADYKPKQVAARALQNTVEYGTTNLKQLDGPLIIEINEAEEYLETLGFKKIKIAGEGKIGGSTENLSFFESEYQEKTGCYEVLAIK